MSFFPYPGHLQLKLFLGWDILRVVERQQTFQQLFWSTCLSFYPCCALWAGWRFVQGKSKTFLHTKGRDEGILHLFCTVHVLAQYTQLRDHLKVKAIISKILYQFLFRLFINVCCTVRINCRLDIKCKLKWRLTQCFTNLKTVQGIGRIGKLIMVTGSLAVKHALTIRSQYMWLPVISVSSHCSHGGISTLSSAFLNNRAGELKRLNWRKWATPIFYHHRKSKMIKRKLCWHWVESVIDWQ